MPEHPDSSPRALLVSYVDRIAKTQQSILELQGEMNQLRSDARADGFNLEAIYQLGLIVSKSPHDGGIGLLTDLFKYCRDAGIDFHPETAINDTSIHNSKSASPNKTLDVSHFTKESPAISERLSVVIQSVLGIIIAASLIWLLH